MTREEELILLQEFIENNGATKLPPGGSGEIVTIGAWGKPRAKKAKSKKTS